jgi:zinc transporter ZupT
LVAAHGEVPASEKGPIQDSEGSVMPRRRAFWIVVFLGCSAAIGGVAAAYTGDASITVGHAIIIVVLGALATGVLAIIWFVIKAIIETVQGARRLLR